MKFGKYLEGRQLELPEYNGHFIDYKGLKKLIKQLAIPIMPNANGDDLSLDDKQHSDEESSDLDNTISYRRLQENKSSFFFRLERELEKVNAFYLEKEANLRIKFNILQSKYINYKDSGKLNSRVAISFKTIYGGFIKFQKDLSDFEQYVELNKTGFSKVLKKWDKRSHSQEKEFYLATVVSVQPIFTRNEALRLNDETLNILIELNDVNNNNNDDNSSHNRSNNMMDTDRSNYTTIDVRMNPENRRLTESLTILNIKPAENSSSTNLYFDTDTKIENWYIEILNISKLKDDDRRNNMLRNFKESKIENFINENIKDVHTDKNTILRECLSKLFLLLISSTIDDASLQVVYESADESIDLLYWGEDEEVFTKRNILHEAMHCPTQLRDFIIKVTLQTQTTDILKNLLNSQDIYLRTPLHYAAELGKLNAVSLILESQLMKSIDIRDGNSKTPLIFSIINNHIDITRKLLVDGSAAVIPHTNEVSEPQFSPLSTACRYNNYEATELILQLREKQSITLKSESDPASHDILHIVSKTGGDARLVKLLIEYGADPNGIDTFNKWTAIFYAIQDGNAETVKILLNNGARLDIYDDDNKSPLFYTLWESHIGVLNAILPYINKLEKLKPLNQHILTPIKLEQTLDDLHGFNGSLEHIPDFTLPPPIIPLRKYGHNFLERKIFIKLSLTKGSNSITFNKEEDVVLNKPGRMTLTSSLSDMIPRNIIFPVDQDAYYEEGGNDSHEVTFLIDTLENFNIDFEIFSAFGTRLLAKSTAMSHFFTSEMVSSLRDIVLPLFDNRLNCVGKLNLQYQVILPYVGKPLQITKYEPYWKSTGNSNNNSAMTNIEGNNINVAGLNFVTSSSLSGSFISLKVFALNDGTVVTSSNFYLETNGTRVLLNDLTADQLEKMCGYKIDEINIPAQMYTNDNSEEMLSMFKKLIGSKICKFETLLKALPKYIQLIIQVCFPTSTEIEKIPIKISPFITINKFIDNILHVLFEHERSLRHSGENIRSIVFSSCNWQACSILNWKQPNFPVLLRMNTLTKSEGVFVSDTPHRLKSLAIKNVDIASVVAMESEENIVQVKEKKSSESQNISEDNGPIRMHEMVRFAINNNLLGIIIPFELLNLCDTLISTIKGQELLLIGSSHDNSVILMKDDTDINGCYYDSELIFN